MMRRFILFWALLVLIAAPAWAADTNKYPSTLVDQTCTDSFDVPAAYTPGVTAFGPGGSVVSPAALVQLSGNPDTFCDNDSRIKTGALTADLTFGPFAFPKGARGLLLYIDIDTLVEDGVGTVQFQLQGVKPHSGAVQAFSSPAAENATADYLYQYGFPTAEFAYTGSPAADEWAVPVPPVYYIMYNEQTATSITMELSQVVIY